LIAQMKADSSRAIAVTMTFGRLPFRVSDRKRPHNLICVFQAISRTACGEAATFICFLEANTRRMSIAPSGFDQNAPRPTYDGWQFRLRVNREAGDHVVYLDPVVAKALVAYVKTKDPPE
jgi:hypothetical protein